MRTGGLWCSKATRIVEVEEDGKGAEEGMDAREEEMPQPLRLTITGKLMKRVDMRRFKGMASFKGQTLMVVRVFRSPQCACLSRAVRRKLLVTSYNTILFRNAKSYRKTGYR
jgi:hypothetical protein